MSREATLELEGLLTDLATVWKPFANSQEDWTTEAGLDRLVASRDEALAKATPILEKVHATWPVWEHSTPDDKERARVFSLRNKLLDLALEASRFETGLETGLKRRIEEGRGQAALSDKRSRAAFAYGRMSML